MGGGTGIFGDGAGLVTDREMQTEDCNCGYAKENAKKHGGDEPGGAVGGARRGLGDAHGVDEGVREEKEKLHVLCELAHLYCNREKAWRLFDESWRGCVASFG